MINSDAIYVIELDRWGIKNNGTDAINSTKGINSALLWAKDNGFNHCKLPSGQYLIDKDNKIELVNDFTLDLFGCLIKKETNGYQKYLILNIENKRNVTLIGGIIEGDKSTHDYQTIPGTHEWGTGINIGYSKNIKIDSVEIKETTGYGISVGSKYHHAYWVYLSELESGTFDASGNPITNNNWVRSNKFYQLSNSLIQQQGYFMICGNGYGDYGNGIDLTKKMVSAYFFDNKNFFLGKINRRTFEPFYLTSIPEGASKFKLSYMEDISTIGTSTTTIRSDAFSSGVNIINCFIHDCRTLGIVGGGQYINIENCEISRIGGAAPGYGIDLEDGYNLNQNITIRNNYFHDNKNGDIVVISARNVLVEMNKFNNTVSFGGARGENYISQYNEYNGAQGTGSSLAGGDGTFVAFRYDHFSESQAYLSGNSIYENSIFDNMNFILQSDNYLTTQFRNCRFNFNKIDEGWSWLLRKGSLIFDSCEFNVNCKWYYFRSEAHAGDWSKNKLVFVNNTFNTKVSLGESVYEVNELILENNTFVGRQDKTNYYGFWAKANKFSMTNNNVRDVYFRIEGKGINSTAVITNNRVLIDKNSTVSGLDRSEFLRLTLFDKVFFQNNVINIPRAIVLLRGFTIYAEKQLIVNGNYFNCDSGTNARLDLFGALRDSNNNNTVPPLTAVINDNIINNFTLKENVTFTSQLSKPVFGTNINIS
ncbi:right-handed parallel beta-helix repeat-containing protein [Metabacillus dongyingensis]|uniref:right-handed parallel beta-helix repeat-containing protein n=1 Tax=Metabacillus dongyingensis TaxID=2874282 RepID=UPI001CBE330F|nr:right-handed parallel beta-helix repeat-containing protein [Metabacillus dongyingensis]UAL50260.1 right-handed parallel beta-helix repeat-containing protein [Metabacillus dongyingensis]